MPSATNLPKPLPRSWLTFDYAALAHNIRQFAALGGGAAQLLVVVKANAYGHGVMGVVQTALAARCKYFGVANLAEALEIKTAYPEAAILVLSPLSAAEIAPAVAAEIILSAHSLAFLQQVSQAAVAAGKDARLHLQVDTGMGRLGFLPEILFSQYEQISKLPNLRFEGIYTHFAAADKAAASAAQAEKFAAVLRQLRARGIDFKYKHAAASAAAILCPAVRYNMLRVGLGVYGCACPSSLASKIDLRPVLSWHCQIVEIKNFPAGSLLGYDGTFQTKRPTRAAILPVGYADGYPRCLSNCASVLINGQPAPVVGLISMDCLLADITEVRGELAVGDQATLIGANGALRRSAEELAELAGTIPYEIVTCCGSRSQRREIFPQEF